MPFMPSCLLRRHSVLHSLVCPALLLRTAPRFGSRRPAAYPGLRHFERQSLSQLMHHLGPQ
eukprot:2534073-Heterocapsa_arctica.AAC.1